MTFFTKLVFGMLLTSASLSACATDDNASGANEGESTALLQVDSATSIKSIAALDSYLKNTPSSPLHRLAPIARQRFLHSLTFSKDGVSSFQYSELKSLSASEIYEILRLFGVERTAALISPGAGADVATSLTVGTNGLPGDRMGYRCAGAGTCTASQESICTPTCARGGNPTQPF